MVDEGVEVKLDITAGPSTLDDVQTALDDFWSHHDEVPREVRMEVGIAAAEIVANILNTVARVASHGNPGSARRGRDRVHRRRQSRGGRPVHRPYAGRGRRARARPALARAALRMLAYFRDEVGNHWKLVSKAITSAGKNET